MTRKIISFAALLLGAFAVCRANDSGYYMKATAVDSAQQTMEAKFVITPEELRLVCKGDTRGISVGDYIKVERKLDKFVVGKMECFGMKWYRGVPQ